MWLLSRSCASLTAPVGARAQSDGGQAHGAAGVHARSGDSVRRRSLSDRPSGAGAGERVDGRRQRRASRLSAAARFVLAVEPRDGQQHLRPGPAAVGHSRRCPDRCCRRRPARASGAAPPARCSRGNRSTSACASATVAGAEAAVDARARRRSADASRRAERGRRGVPERVWRPSAPSRRRRPTSSAATCSRARVHTLVDNQLRPGAEASRADAERAAAQTRLIQAQADADAGADDDWRACWASRRGASRSTRRTCWTSSQPPTCTPARRPRIRSPRCVRRPSTWLARRRTVLARTDLSAPLPAVERLRARQRRESERRVRRRRRTASASIARTGRPACRSSFRTSSTSPACAPARRRRRRRARAETALYDEALLTITSQQQAAAAMVQAARAVAANTPVQLAAAQQSEAQARARYEAGLASIVEVADAQSLLAQAEVQDQLARVDVWRALLARSGRAGQPRVVSDASFIRLTGGR